MNDGHGKARTKPKAVVIGGSMAGLFAALLLRRAGWQVDVYERIGAELAGRGRHVLDPDRSIRPWAPGREDVALDAIVHLRHRLHIVRLEQIERVERAQA